MRKRTAVLLVMLLLVFSLGIGATPPANCADCDKAEHDCTEQELQELNDCCNLFGCQDSYSISYCLGTSQDRYKGCMIAKGCSPRHH